MPSSPLSFVWPAKWTGCVAICCTLLAAGEVTGTVAAMRSEVAPQVRRTTTFYELGATSLFELVAEFRAVAGRGGVPLRYGLTKWDIRLDMSPEYGTRTSCSTDRVMLRVALTTVLPKAVRSEDFSPEEAIEWQRFLTALIRHEAQHDSIVVAHTTAFLRDVERDANRKGGPTSIDQCVASLLERIEHASRTFDTRTQHGGKEGAALRVFHRTPLGLSLPRPSNIPADWSRTTVP